MSFKNFYNPVEISFGINSLQIIPEIIRKYALNSRILIVTDENLLDLLGISEKIRQCLNHNPLTFKELKTQLGLDTLTNLGLLIKQKKICSILK